MMAQKEDEAIEFGEDIAAADMSVTERKPICLTIYEEMNTSESESDESIEESREYTDRIRVDCGEHSSLGRLGYKVDGDQKEERKTSIKNGQRKISIKNVKVKFLMGITFFSGVRAAVNLCVHL